MTIAPFSPLEIQLVRASLSTKTTVEISLLLERSAEDITILINDITDGCADQREQDVKLYMEEKVKAKKKVGRPPRDSEAIALEKKRKQESKSLSNESATKSSVAAAMEHHYKKRREAESKRKYKTRIVDPATLITVRLDDKTWAQVERQATPELTDQLIKKTKAAYEANKTLNQYKTYNNN